MALMERSKATGREGLQNLSQRPATVQSDRRLGLFQQEALQPLSLRLIVHDRKGLSCMQCLWVLGSAGRRRDVQVQGSPLTVSLDSQAADVWALGRPPRSAMQAPSDTDISVVDNNLSTVVLGVGPGANVCDTGRYQDHGCRTLKGAACPNPLDERSRQSSWSTPSPRHAPAIPWTCTANG